MKSNTLTDIFEDLGRSAESVEKNYEVVFGLIICVQATRRKSMVTSIVLPMEISVHRVEVCFDQDSVL